MRLTALALAAALTTGLVAPLAAQETAEPDPPTFLLVASFICPMSSVADIGRNYESFMKPIEQEMVAEGTLASAGLYFHVYADEWNVHHYRIGYDPADLITAAGTATQRMLERNPEQMGDMGGFGACTAHKDNIYGFGPGTTRPDMFTTGGGN